MPSRERRRPQVKKAGDALGNIVEHAKLIGEVLGEFIYGMCVAEKTVAPPETIDTTASLSSLVVRSRSGICEENISSSSWVFNVTDIFFNAPLAQISDEWLVISEISIAKVCLCRGMAKDKGKAIKIAKWQWHSFCWSSIIV